MDEIQQTTGESETFPLPLPQIDPVDPTPPMLAVTLGDPAGVGPELCLRLIARSQREKLPYGLCIIGDIAPLRSAAEAAGLSLAGEVCSLEPFRREASSGRLGDLRVPLIVDTGFLSEKIVVPGEVQPHCGKASGEYIRFAAEGVLKGWFGGVLTSPINKESLHLGGFDFPGHTEMLASLCGVSGREAMLLYSERISVAFATLHTALAEACRSLRIEEIVRIGVLTDRTLRRLHGRPVRIGVLGLNPHAGENGLFGNEEATVIRPAIDKLEREGVLVDGPLVPDAAFVPDLIHRFEGYLCMYHDQGSIPFKMLSFDTGVNHTMGLPIVRTSPDHGTAFDIAWKGIASPSSFFAAADLAGRLMQGDGD